MKRSLFKVFAISLAVLLLFTGCSSSSGGNNNVNNAGKTNNDKPMTLKLSTWQMDQEGYGQFWKEAIQEFHNQHNNVTIEPINYSPTDYSNRILVDITAGSPGDIITFAGFDFAQLNAMNAFEPLDSYLKLNKDEFNENILNYGKIDNKFMGYPIMARTLQLLYNKELFQKAGISSPPKDPQEFYNDLKLLTQKQGNTTTQFGYGFDTNNNRYLYEDALIWSLGFGGNFAEKGKPTVNDPKTIEGIKFLRQMVAENLVPQGINKSDVRLGFAKGNIAMLIDGAWILPLVEKQNPNLVKNIGVAPTPFSSHVTTGGGMNFVGLSKSSKNKDMAASFIEMISKPQWQQRWFELTKTLPAGKNVITDKMITENPYLPEFIKGLDTVVPVPPEGLEAKYNKFSEIVQSAVVKTIFSNESADSLMGAAQTELEKALK